MWAELPSGPLTSLPDPGGQSSQRRQRLGMRSNRRRRDSASASAEEDSSTGSIAARSAGSTAAAKRRKSDAAALAAAAPANHSAAGASSGAAEFLSSLSKMHAHVSQYDIEALLDGNSGFVKIRNFSECYASCWAAVFGPNLAISPQAAWVQCRSVWRSMRWQL